MLDLLKSVAQSVRQPVIINSGIEKPVHRHNKLPGYLARRLDKNTFVGLPLTLLSTVFFYVLLLIGGIAENFLALDSIVAADMRIDSLMVALRTPLLVRFFLWITMLGKWQVVMAFSFVLLDVLWVWRERYLFIPFLVALAGSQIFTYLGKVILQRPRPMIAVYTQHSFSFPSGHAAVSVAFYGFVAYVLLSRTTIWKRKVNYIFTGTLLVLLIGFSRVYLGVHYMSDVLSGYFIGSLWLIIGITLSRYQRPDQPREFDTQKAKVAWIVPVLIAAAVNWHRFYPGRDKCRLMCGTQVPP